MGTLTAQSPAFLLGAFQFFYYWLLFSSVGRDRRIPAAYAGYGFMCVLLSFAAAWPTLILFALVGFLVMMPPPPARNPKAAIRRKTIGRVVFRLALAMPPLSIFLLSTDMWLPEERLRLEDGRVITGYVLEEEGEWVSALRESDRELVFFRPEELAAREVCDRDQPSFDDEPSVADVLQGLFGDAQVKPTYDDCAEPTSVEPGG